MSNSLFFKPLSLAFAIITLIVSVIWSILSLLAILCYNDVFGNDHNHLSFGLRNFTNNLYDLYLSGTNISVNRLVPPSTFYVLMWIYFLLTLFLVFSSGVQIVVLIKKTKPRKFNFSTIVWLFLNYAVCVFDFLTCILFGIDYYYIREEYNADTATTEVILAVPITLILLSAKGFVLWIFNVTFTVMITVLFTQKASSEPILKYNPEFQANNNVAYDSYGDQEDNRKRSTGTDSQWTENSGSSDNSSHESENSIYNINTTGAITPISAWTPVPRVHTDSYVRPRSLVASLNPSPIPPPTLEEPSRQHESLSIYHSYRSINDYDYDYVDPQAEVAEIKDPSYLKPAYPETGRFTLKEPQAEIAEMSDPSYLKSAFPKTRRFTLEKPQAEIAELNDPSHLKSAYPEKGRFTLNKPQAEIAEMSDPSYLKSAFPKAGRFTPKKPQAEIAEMSDPSYLKSAFPKAGRFVLKEPQAEIAEMSDPSYLKSAFPKPGRFTPKKPQAEIAPMSDQPANPSTKKLETEEPEPDYY